MLIRCVEQKIDGKSMKLKKDWVPLNEISPNLQLAVVCSEDQNFIDHNGFDFQAINKAMDYNATHKKQRGASTISQQTAKNVFLWTSHSWVRKGFEVYFTFLIETFWSKQRIMEVYLNVIEMGDGISFTTSSIQKAARNLTKGESSLIAAVLPNPIKFYIAKPSDYVRKRQAWIIHQMAIWGMLSYDEKSEKKK